MLRALLVWVHKYMGLFLGLLLSITGISGSMVVFDRELDEMLAPDTVNFETATALASFDLAFANATEAVNNGSAPTRIALGRHLGAPHIIRFPALEGAAGPLEVSIDPGTSEVTAIRNWGEYPVTWFYSLHLSFLTGEMGKLLVGVMGICLLFFSISGMVIWWPKKGAWKRAFTIKTNGGPFRLNFDLHKTIGIYFIPLFLMLSITGIEIVWHEPVHKLVALVLPVEDPVVPVSTGDPQGSPILVDDLAEKAMAVFPDSRINRIYLPGSDTAPYVFTFTHPDDAWTEYSVTSLYFDQYDGALLNVWDGRDKSAGTVMLNWFFPLHNGDALGLVGRILVFISGLLPAVLFGTGVYMWWRKRKPAK